MTTSIYQQLRDDHVAAMVALRYGPSERSLITRMVQTKEIEHCSVSPNLEPRQLPLFLAGRDTA